MASNGALPGSMLRQKWLHVIQARPRARPCSQPLLNMHARLPRARCVLPAKIGSLARDQTDS